jgi:four helix bundle protein
MRGYYKDLLVWSKGMDLVHAIYLATEIFPKRETYGLADQMRRAAVSVPSNIAEGQGYANRREFLRYLRHSRGSLFELETQLRIATRLQYVDPTQSERLLQNMDEISRMLSGLANSLKKLNTSGEEVKPVRD